MSVATVNQILAILTALGEGAFVLLLLSLIIPGTRWQTMGAVRNYGLWAAFTVALVATLGSLYYSEIAGFDPCRLCWFQRIGMYPLVPLLGMAAWRRDWRIADYALPLVIIGGTIAFYHVYIFYGGGAALGTCDESGVSCVRRYVFELGYITIPLMSLSAFALIGAILGSGRAAAPAITSATD